MTTLTLLEKINQLFNCNPDLPAVELQEIYSLASTTPSEQFDCLAERVQALIDCYLESSPKQTALTLFREYAVYLERSARLLADSGKISTSEARNLIKSNHSMALLPINISDSLTWCNVLSYSEVPKPLKDAIFSCQRRNEYVSSVLEIAFNALRLVDSSKATSFLLQYLEATKNNPDYDLIRDCLLVWLNEETELPQAVLQWCKEWSLSEAVRQMWPYVSTLSDQVLRRQVVLRLSKQPPIRSNMIARLQRIGRHPQTIEVQTQSWYDETLEQMSKSIVFFTQLSQKESLSDLEKKALAQELRNMEQLFPYLLLCADCSYEQPDGLRVFSLAFFGLSGTYLSQWHEELERHSEKALARLSLLYMKENKSLDEFIERFTFGNQEECQRLQNKLDLATRSFPNMKIRRYVLGILSAFYAGSREPHLLAAEVAKCYRNWRRLVHEDYLRICLLPEDFEYWQRSPLLQEINTLCGEIRKYLDKRRSATATVEEIIAAEMDLFLKVRELRVTKIEQLISQFTQAK